MAALGTNIRGPCEDAPGDTIVNPAGSRFPKSLGNIPSRTSPSRKSIWIQSPSDLGLVAKKRTSFQVSPPPKSRTKQTSFVSSRGTAWRLPSGRKSSIDGPSIPPGACTKPSSGSLSNREISTFLLVTDAKIKPVFLPNNFASIVSLAQCRPARLLRHGCPLLKGRT